MNRLLVMLFAALILSALASPSANAYVVYEWPLEIELDSSDIIPGWAWGADKLFWRHSQSVAPIVLEENDYLLVTVTFADSKRLKLIDTPTVTGDYEHFEHWVNGVQQYSYLNYFDSESKTGFDDVTGELLVNPTEWKASASNPSSMPAMDWMDLTSTSFSFGGFWAFYRWKELDPFEANSVSFEFIADSIEIVPEPSTILLLITGAFGLLLHTRRRR